MLEVDLEKFWADNDIAMKDNCFNPAATQTAMGIRMHEECVFDELGEAGNPWGDNPPEKMARLCRLYNDKAEQIVGRRLLNEKYPRNREIFKIPKIGVVFGGRYTYNNGIYWLEGDIKTPGDLEKMLDLVDKTDVRQKILPPGWEENRKKVFESTGETMDIFPWGRAVRGPTTLAMSLCGIENIIFWMYDCPDLIHRFFDTIERVILEYVRIVDTEAGPEKVKAQGSAVGFQFSDDNCCMLNPELYEEFTLPVLQHVFDKVCPNPEDFRYQHSDSKMDHLLPELAKLNFTAVNFGPTVLADQIRRYMPKTRIDGCLSPMTFLSNNDDAIIAEVKRDCEMEKKGGFRGICEDTAGSVNFGTRLTSMRAVMYAIQKYGQY
jgi:uroporphyrinogen decarboxylase